MKRCLCLALTLLLLLELCSHTNALIDFQKFKDKEHPDQCVIKHSGGKLKIRSGDQEKYPGDCKKIYCGLKSWALVYTCDGLPPPKRDCEWGDYIDVNAKFPNCCKRQEICRDLAEYDANNLM